jgi:hypothetical protein
VRFRIPLIAVGTLAPLTTLLACGAAQGGDDAPPQRPVSRAAAIVSAVLGPAAPASSGPCGSKAAEVLARADGLAATRIYANELASTEVFSDRRQVESYAPLLSALESGNRGAIDEAVTSLVYSRTHIVRLRVTRGGVVLADIGGPYILAPVGGTLRRNGRTLGRYVLSVQDDSGYVKLVSRFIGVPLILSRGLHALAVEGAVRPGPATIPAHGAVTYRGRSYQAFSLPAEAFPSGSLRISLLVPVDPSLSGQTCTTITVAGLGRVAQRISRRFNLSASNFSSYIKATAPITGGLIYIRSGTRQLAGSSRAGPAKLPSHGQVTYRGSAYGVFSFNAPSQAGQVRIYQLVRP